MSTTGQMEALGLNGKAQAGDSEACSTERRKGNGGAPPLPAGHAQPTVGEIDFAVLEDGSLVDLVEDPQDARRTLFAVWQDGEVRLTDHLQTNGRKLLPLRREDELSRQIRLPRGTKPYGSVAELFGRVRDLLTYCLVLNEPYADILANFVLSTWVIDRLPVAPYASVVGLPASGKTTLLLVLRLVCRRSLLTADVSSAALYAACGRFTPTLLIDEAATQGNSRLLRHLLRSGTTRDVVAMRRNRTFHAFGAKVISWLEPPNDPALNSRCILIPMREASGANLLKPTDPRVEETAQELQKSLLQFRFEKYQAIQPVSVPGSEGLRPRARDLLECLAAPFATDGQRCQFLLTFFQQQSVVMQEPLSPPESAVLAALFHMVHLRSEFESMYVANLTAAVNQILRESGGSFRVNPRKVGSVLTALGLLTRSRTREGWRIWLDRNDRRRIHELAKTYGLDYHFRNPAPISSEECAVCIEMGMTPGHIRGQEMTWCECRERREHRTARAGRER